MEFLYNVQDIELLDVYIDKGWRQGLVKDKYSNWMLPPLDDKMTLLQQEFNQVSSFYLFLSMVILNFFLEKTTLEKFLCKKGRSLITHTPFSPVHMQRPHEVLT